MLILRKETCEKHKNLYKLKYLASELYKKCRIKFDRTNFKVAILNFINIPMQH